MAKKTKKPPMADWVREIREKHPDLCDAARAVGDATNWLALLQFNKKMPNSLVARKMKTTRKHVAAILGGQPTLNDLARMFYVLGYRLHIYTEDIKTGKKSMRPPKLLPHALNHPHIRGQLKSTRG